MAKPKPNLNVGGQAVIEGVMMRGASSMAVAVRKKDGHIWVQEIVWKSLFPQLSLKRLPFIRGVLVFLETMYNGMCALKFSAVQTLEDHTDIVNSENKKNLTFLSSFIFALLIVLCGFIVAPHLVTEFFVKDVTSPFFQVVDGVIKIAFFISYLLLISRLADVKKLFQYHGAEHKSIHAYEAQKELTVDNARKYPTLHPRCGTSFITFVLLTSVVVFTLVLPLLVSRFSYIGASQIELIILKLFLLLPIAGLSYEWIRIANKKENLLFTVLNYPGLLLQKITTKEPTDDQLEVALAALKRVI